ncbi:hypothetical protein ACOZ4N_15850 [Halorientalis pallida]|uniref:hypothetical protein n=1 Tax=Halorientalis pallida TaxID=2479928 RepID=UPI003C7023E0
MRRRKMLAALGSAGLIGIAGCSSNGSETSGQDTTDETPTPTPTSSSSDGGTTPTETQSDETTQTATETETATDVTDSPTSTPLNLTNYPSCVPVNDEGTATEIYDLLPIGREETGDFADIQNSISGFENIETPESNGRTYREPNGEGLAELSILKYSSQNVAEENIQQVRQTMASRTTDYPAIGLLLSNNMVVAVGASSESRAKSLIDLSGIECPDNFVFVE